MKNSMNRFLQRYSTFFLQAVVLLMALCALAFLLWEPHLEGRNAHAGLVRIYFQDPFLAYVYAGSIPLFVALYQAFKALGFVRHNKIFSTEAMKAFQTLKYAALSLIGFAVAGECFIPLGESDDRAGGLFMGFLIIFGSTVMAATAAMCEWILQSALDSKAGKDSWEA